MFIEEPAPSPERQALYEGDVANLGYVMNLTRAWAWIPAIHDGLFGLLNQTAQIGGLSYRDKGILITAMASRLGDSYCALAWGTKLAEATDPPTAAAVLVGQPSSSMTARDDALASWARKLAVAPNSTTQADVDSLRAIGMSDQQIVAATAYVALRVAFSTVNDAIGAVPDRERAEAAPSEVVSAIGFGRPIDQSPSTGR
jgi:uncharacterized peroxidase-related enzyme